MTTLQITLIAIATLFVAYTYAGYPALLWVLGRLRRAKTVTSAPSEWPTISITVPAYNEEGEVRDLIEQLLELDYPRDRMQILVVSDASTDRTDEIVLEYADRGIELLRMPVRAGKTAAENAARAHLRGEIVVNTDASIRLDRHALKPLVAPFADPTVGVVSGRDVSVARHTATHNAGEAGYVGYEMWVRDLETRVDGIVGASGCCYAIRATLHGKVLPEGLSRDFASALVARTNGYRAVSVSEAICYVPRTALLRVEYRRKVRTITRGIETLVHLREVLNPFRYGLFAAMLWNHKICRWLVPWVALAALVGVVAEGNLAGLLIGAAAAVTIGLGTVAIFWPSGRSIPQLFALPGYFLVGNLAAVHASLRALHGDRNALWEPTRRSPIAAN